MSSVEQASVQLIGDTVNHISGDKLPSKRDVLLVLFHNTRVKKMGLRESARNVIRDVVVFWKKVGLPTQTEQKMIDKLENLHKEWNAVVKNKEKASNKTREEQFRLTLDDLFDVAHANVLSDVAPFRAMFLQQQRQPGRPGNLSDLHPEIEKEEKKRLLEERRLTKSKADIKRYGLYKFKKIFFTKKSQETN